MEPARPGKTPNCLVFVTLVVAAIGCGGKIASTDSGSAVQGTAQGGAAAAAACTQEPTPEDRFASADVLRSLLVGRWLLCAPATDQTALGFRVTGYAGLEFTADGTLYVLRPDGTGTIVRSTTDGTFQYSIVDANGMGSSGAYVIEVARNNGGNILWAAFTSSHHEVAFTNSMIGTTRMVASP